LAVKDAGLTGYDSFMNVVILVSVVSIGVSCVYGGSRTLTALAEQGYAPPIFKYIDRSGRPLMSVLVNLAFGAIAYIVLASSGQIVFNWLLALSGLAALFTWGSICVAHIRFRAAWAHAGRHVDEIPFHHIFGTTGSWIGLAGVIIALVAQFFSAIAPPRGGVNDAEGFFESYLALPVVLAFWAIGYLWKREGVRKLDQIDLDSGRRPIDWDVIHANRARVASWPVWRRALHAIF
jgi:yeast amino acid transporter